MVCVNTYSLVGEYVLDMHHIFSQYDPPWPFPLLSRALVHKAHFSAIFQQTIPAVVLTAQQKARRQKCPPQKTGL